MAQVNRANSATNLNTTTAWTGGVVPTATDIAAWGTPLITTGTAQALGGSVSWQGVLLQSAQTSAITIAATAGATLTLGTSGIDLSASGANLTVASLVALGPATQTWIVASGRTLTVSGQLTASAKNVTLSGAGSFSLTGANTTTWTNSTITVASGAYWNIANANGPGAASNSIVVANGASAGTNQAILPASITLSGTGTGTAATRFAYHANTAQGAGRTFTFAGTRTMFLSMNSLTAATHAAKFTGTTSAETVLVAGNNTTLTNTSNDFVAGGNGVEFQSYQTNGSEDGRWAIILSGDVSDVATFGNASNPVYIQTTGAFQTTAATANRTISRNFKIEGHTVTGAVPAAADIFNNSATKLSLTGTVNLLGTSSLAATFDSATGGSVALAGTLTGAGNISVVAGGTVELATGLTLSSYTGNVVVGAATIKYGIGGITGTATFANNAIIDNASASLVTLSHSSYSVGTVFTFLGSTGPLSTGFGAISGALSSLVVSGSTLTIPGNITSTQAVAKSGAGTLVLAGNNSFLTSFTHSGGGLELNSAGSAGANTFFISAITANTLDSTTGATLSRTASNSLGGNFTWKGTADLNLGTGSVAATISEPTITFANGGQIGTLKFAGSIATSALTTNWDFGGATASAKQRVTLVGANASLSDATAANQHAVTAGYFRIENNNGLGAVTATTTWWVGATNLGVQTTKAALELVGVTTPDVKNVKLYNIGPNNDGALIGASGTSEFRGGIEVPNVAGTRIGVKNGATLTLLGSGIYPNLNPANAGTPLSFTAESGCTLNQNRILGANTGTVTVTNGIGNVVFSRANLHTGVMTCSAGTTKLTHANAAGATSGNSVTVTAGATMEVAVKAVFPATLTLGSSGSAATFKVSV